MTVTCAVVVVAFSGLLRRFAMTVEVLAMTVTCDVVVVAFSGLLRRLAMTVEGCRNDEGATMTRGKNIVSRGGDSMTKGKSAVSRSCDMLSKEDRQGFDLCIRAEKTIKRKNNTGLGNGGERTVVFTYNVNNGMVG